jgi:hypothetical protein
VASSNVTGKIVLCSAPAQAKFRPPRIAFGDALNQTLMAGAKGLIFAQYTTNLMDSLAGIERIMPVVLVDFEIAQRLISYFDMAG